MNPAGRPWPVTVETHGSTGVLILDDAGRRNMLSEPMIAGIEQALAGLEADPGIRAVVVTGRGPAFCAGAPLDVLEAAADGDFSRTRRAYDAFLRVAHSPLPTIAAVNGPATGAGFNLALACDVVVISDAAWLQSRFAALNLHPGGGHLWLLQQRVGHSAMAAAVLLDAHIDAETAVRSGLAYRRFPADDLVAGAVELASGLAGADPAYARTLKQSVGMRWTDHSYADAVAQEEQLQRESARQEAFRSALARLRARLARSRPPENRTKE